MESIDSYRQRIEERNIVKQESKSTIIICFSVLFLDVVLGVAAFFLKVKPVLRNDTLENIWNMVNLGIIILLIAVLALRKTIYYSPRLIKENFTLKQVLAKWKRIDLFLLAVSQVMPVCGLVMIFLGMPFESNYHFFVASGILIILLTPLGIKVRSRLSILKKHFPDIH